jgi:protocatechuate 3,4-dioxygenase beta subunit
MTDESGVARFITIYPGSYNGRAVHIHFKIHTDPGSPHGHEFTSQLYFDESVTDDVHAQAPYNAKGRRRTKNATDGLFQRGGGKDLMLLLTKDAKNYAGSFDIGLRTT